MVRPITPSPATARVSPWKRYRRGFRICRIVALSVVLILLAGLTWLRVFGLPNFLRLRIVSELARHGVAANFRSLHFHWFRGFVADDLHVTWKGAGDSGVTIAIAEADLDITPPLAWWRTSRLLRGLSVLRGSVILPLQLPQEPPTDLRLDDISAQIRFMPGDHWEIPRLAARLEGFQFELSASITNTAALRRPRPEASRTDPAARERFVRLARGIVQELRTWTPSSSAKVAISLHVDGNRLNDTRADLFLEVPSAKSPRGEILDLRLSVRSQPSPSPELPSHASVVFELGELQSSRGGVSQLAIRAQLAGPSNARLITNATWEIHADHVFARNFRARDASATGKSRIPNTPDLQNASIDTELQAHARRIEAGPGATPPVTLLHSSLGLIFTGRPRAEMPTRIDGTLAAGGIESSQGNAGPTTVRVHFAPASPPQPPPPEDIADWSLAWPVSGAIDIQSSRIDSPRLAVSEIAASLEWKAPRLVIRSIDAQLYEGRLQARGDLEVPSRRVVMEAESTFDLHGIDGLLGPKSRENFVRYQWSSPPWVKASGSVTLPPWTEPKPDWNRLVKPTVRVDGRLRVGAGSFKGIGFDTAESSISFDGSTWRLPDLKTSRPEGRQEIAVEYNEDSREYRIDARGRVLPPVLKPVLGDASAQIVDLFEFRNGIDATVSVWGPWTEGNRQAIVGTVEATNFTFRAQHFDRLETSIHYTNRFLHAAPLKLVRGTARADADAVGYDFEDDRLWLTNATTDIDPMIAAAAIGPDLPAKLAPYRFRVPPRIRANGTLRPRHTESADLRVEVSAGPFEFWRLKADTLETELLWKGTTLTLTNISGRFFEGTLAGNAFFELSNPDDGLYRFEAQVRQAELGPLLRHATEGRTNVPSGQFHLDLTVNSARTSNLYSWEGFGRTELTDGRLWDTPMFSFLSPVLDAVVPGLGNNRARAAEATFTISNSVVHTRDLTIDCPPAKLYYRGTLDFDQNVNAKVEAQILGNFTPIGPFFGLILRPLTKLFEFRTTGTLADVHAEPLYIPKFLLLPLQPLKFLRGIFNGESPQRSNPVHSQPEIPPLNSARADSLPPNPSRTNTPLPDPVPPNP